MKKDILFWAVVIIALGVFAAAAIKTTFFPDGPACARVTSGIYVCR